MSRALSRLGEDKYNVVWNNCEHFANWCIEDEQSSPQVNRIANVASAAATTRMWQAAIPSTDMSRAWRGIFSLTERAYHLFKVKTKRALPARHFEAGSLLVARL